MRNLIVILVLSLACGCSDHMSKSIFEPLSLKELNKSIKQNPDFEDLYNEIQSINSTLTAPQKAKYMELTYDRVFNIDTLPNHIANQQLNQWREAYKTYEQRIDSIANSFKSEENIPERIKNYIETGYMSDGEYIIKEFINPNFKTTEDLHYELKAELNKIDSL